MRVPTQWSSGEGRCHLCINREGADGLSGVVGTACEAEFLSKLRQALKEKTYRAEAVRRVYIPKSGGKKRPLGIPTLRDRVAQMSVKIVIKPIFEADFEGCSYGFRPKRDAHQAVGAKSKRGTPQGRVISPLLANIYLHQFDQAFLTYCSATGLTAHLVRYADDFVILMRGGVEATLEKTKEILGRMELRLNEEKSRVVDARESGFDFLGFCFSRKRNRRTGKVITLVEPSNKSELHFRDEVRRLTGRWSHYQPEGEVLERMNRFVRGWINYFHLHNATQVFRRQRFFLEQRMRKYLQKRRQRKGFGYRRWPTARLYREFGLYAIPVHAPYRRTRMP